jgi:hypothetical protein
MPERTTTNSIFESRMEVGLEPLSAVSRNPLAKQSSTLTTGSED